MIVEDVATRPRAKVRTNSSRTARCGWRLLRAWHLFNLDAPTVAVLWAALMGRVAGVRPGATDLAILGIGTWLMYTADRLLDGLPGLDPARLRERHLFHRRWRRPMMVASAVAVAVLSVLILERMRAPLRTADTRLFSLALVYFACVHSRRSFKRWRVKEVAVAVLFATACGAPAWTMGGSDHRRLVPATLLFAGLCWLNCAAIEQWERKGVGDCGAPWPAWLAAWAGALTATALGTLWLPGTAAAGACVATSAIALMLLGRTRLSPPQLRILADVALLTPLFRLLR